jgi:hypothetical protein
VPASREQRKGKDGKGLTGAWFGVRRRRRCGGCGLWDVGEEDELPAWAMQRRRQRARIDEGGDGFASVCSDDRREESGVTLGDDLRGKRGGEWRHAQLPPTGGPDRGVSQ